MIRLTGVNKYYNRKKNNEIHVINETSIELADKGLVTFLGHSGCGKTTLLNAIGGLDKVDSGEILIDGERMTTRSEGKKDELRNACVGYIFQNYNLIEDETVFNNVALVDRAQSNVHSEAGRNRQIQKPSGKDAFRRLTPTGWHCQSDCKKSEDHHRR